MTTFAAQAYTAFSSQTLLIGYPEHCSVDPDKLSAIGRSVGEQIRLVHGTSGKKGLATVVETRNESPEKKVRMCSDGRARWDDTSNWDGTADSVCVHPTYSDSEAESNSDFVERLDETSTNHTGLVVCAPHGGAIENYTDEQAERVYAQLSSASKDVTCWRCKGWRAGGGAYDAWHITSTEISRGSFPKLNQIGDRGFAYAVSFHGYSEATIAIGGAASTSILQGVADAIQEAVGAAYDVEVVTSGPYAGTSELNFVNWLTSADQGVQIEQPYGARSTYHQAIADAVASFFATLL